VTQGDDDDNYMSAPDNIRLGVRNKGAQLQTNIAIVVWHAMQEIMQPSLNRVQQLRADITDIRSEIGQVRARVVQARLPATASRASKVKQEPID
jgi:hypothetical protein